MKLKFLSLFLLVFVSLGASPAFALDSSSITISINPENPVPYENTTITLKSFSANLDSVSISWLVDGKSVISGIGKKSFSVNAKGANLETKIEAKIMLPDGEVDKTVTIKPAVMVLLWQANDSYVPPFYRGKALPSAQSEVKVVAMPEIRSGSAMVNPQNLTYIWKKDYSNDQDGSGYGKNYFVYVNDYLESSNNISVVASTIDQGSSSEASLSIGTALPKILFYKNDPTLGTIWEQALLDGHRIQGDETVEAAPYFISPKELQNPTLLWNWFINGSLVNVSGRKNLMPLKVESGVSGTSTLKLEIENQDKIFETADKEIRVEF